MYNYKIYIVYHSDKLLNNLNYNINDNHYILYPTHKNNNEINLNYMHDNLSEFCAMYYVWKNNKYSNFICFNQYRRYINIDINKINEDTCFVHRYDSNLLGLKLTIKDHYIASFGDFGNYLYKIYVNILNDLYGKENIYTYMLDNSYEIIWDSIFFMSYNKFINLCEFLFNIYDCFNKVTNINYDINKCYKFYNNNIYLMRPHMLERLTGIWILNNFKRKNIISKFIVKNNVLNIYNKSL